MNIRVKDPSNAISLTSMKRVVGKLWRLVDGGGAEDSVSRNWKVEHTMCVPTRLSDWTVRRHQVATYY